MTPIEIMEEREAILKLLPQTTPENLTKDHKSITIEPRTRYPNIPIQLIRLVAKLCVKHFCFCIDYRYLFEIYFCTS